MIKSSLPPESAPWGAEVDSRLSKLETGASNLGTLVSSSNSRLNGVLNTQKELSEAQTDLKAVQATTAQQVAFLVDQTVASEASPAGFTTQGPYTTAKAKTWIAFDAAADASITLTVPPSGRLAVIAGGYLWAHSDTYATASAFIGVEVLDSTGANVDGPFNGDGNMLQVWGANTAIGQTGTGHLHVWTSYTPGEEYTFRCRRGYSLDAGSSGYSGTMKFQGTSLTISKAGM